MKTIASLLIVVIISFYSFAQEETLVGNGHITHGGFGGPVIKYTSVNGEPGVLVGGRGGWIINHSFVIGGGGYGLANNVETDANLFWSDRPYLNFGYGGFEMEYIVRPTQLVHFSVYTLIGGGGVSYRGDWWDDKSWDDLDSPSDAFFVFEPALNAELNITSFFRINAGVSYRLISGVNLDDLKNSDLQGASAVLTLKFGKF